MRKILWSLMAISILSVSAFAADAPTSTAAADAAAPSVDDMLKALRTDLQGARADIMAKNLTLTADQAAKFWPQYAKFQSEQNVIVDEQLQNIKKYAENYQTLDDAGALALINAQLSRDAKMNALRTKWLAEFQKVLPGGTAARAIQIDRRLGMAAQLALSSRIPLVN